MLQNDWSLTLWVARCFADAGAAHACMVYRMTHKKLSQFSTMSSDEGADDADDLIVDLEHPS